MVAETAQRSCCYERAGKRLQTAEKGSEIEQKGGSKVVAETAQLSCYYEKVLCRLQVCRVGVQTVEEGSESRKKAARWWLNLPSAAAATRVQSRGLQKREAR